MSWEMVELKKYPQWEMEGELRLHSHLMLLECAFASLKVQNLKAGKWVLGLPWWPRW